MRTCSASVSLLASISAHSARSRVTAHTKLRSEPTRATTITSSAFSSACTSATASGLGSVSAAYSGKAAMICLRASRSSRS